MEFTKPLRVKSITEGHSLCGLPKPQHPLISIVDCADMQQRQSGVTAVTFDFYTVMLKRGCETLRYGQQKYDFDEGVLAFMAPGQVLRGNEDVHATIEGWMLFIHPDFLWGTPLAKKIKQYDYFGYAANEALFLSDREESTINSITGHIQQEYQAPIDKFSQDVIIAQLELLFAYAQRFYERQFITRKITNSKLVDRFEGVLAHYFSTEALLSQGLPTVQYCAEALHISAKYLSSLLKQLTGQSAQQHIHSKLIDQAKEKLSTTALSVSEIAYGLGFEHSQSFSKLFKAKTNQSPLEFRQSFN